MSQRSHRGATAACQQAASPPEPGSPADIIRGLVLATGQVTDAEADLLLGILERLRRIEAHAGREAACQAARRVRAAWLDPAYVPD